MTSASSKKAETKMLTRRKYAWNRCKELPGKNLNKRMKLLKLSSLMPSKSKISSQDKTGPNTNSEQMKPDTGTEDKPNNGMTSTTYLIMIEFSEHKFFKTAF